MRRGDLTFGDAGTGALKTGEGHEILFVRYFYTYETPRRSEEVKGRSRHWSRNLTGAGRRSSDEKEEKI